MFDNFIIATTLTPLSSGERNFATMSLFNPLVPAFAVIPTLIFKHLNFNWTWFRLYNKQRHDKQNAEIIKAKTGLELII